MNGDINKTRIKMTEFKFEIDKELTEEKFQDKVGANIPRPRLQKGDRLEISRISSRISVKTYPDGFKEVYLGDYEIGTVDGAREVGAALRELCGEA